MFTKKALAFLSINALLCAYSLVADVQDEATRKHNKCESFNSLTVCNSVTAGSFITSSGPLFNGLRNYAVLANILDVADGDDVLWGASSAGSRSAGITLALDGTVTLPIGGTFLVVYTVRFAEGGTANTNDTAIAQLQQGGNNIAQAAVTSTFYVAPDADQAALSMPVTGAAIIKTTSSSDNYLNLNISLSSANIALPLATAPDANAQMIILQLN